MDSHSSTDVNQLITQLASASAAAQKLAVFTLQSNLSDPSFADTFIASGGLPKLRYLIMSASGNTLAYSLACLGRLLECDNGWDMFDNDPDMGLVKRVVELVVCEPLVNILRGAMACLVCIVSRPYMSGGRTSPDRDVGGGGGFRALKPAIALYPQFLEMLVSRLSSADHALCANALQLINSLMRDTITNNDGSEWPKFIKRLQDLGVIKAVYVLMQSSALQDLSHPLLEFQALTKVLLKKWRDMPVDLAKPEMRRMVKGIHLSSNPERYEIEDEDRDKPKHNPFKWRRLGFGGESPATDFAEMGFLGMMDFSDYVRKHQDEFQHLLMEQAAGEESMRCPIARACLVSTAVLYEHFEVDKMDIEDAKSYLQLESRTNFDKIFKPLLLHWTRLQVAVFHAFLRLWKSTGAREDDFLKIVELVRILVESVVGGAPRTKGIEEIERELADFEYGQLRELQMELLELTYEDTWGPHLHQIKDELQTEALQFVKEQRIRCLLAGAWFTQPAGQNGYDQRQPSTVENSHRYIKLSHNRRYLHYADFDDMAGPEPELDELAEKIDLSIVSSVVSNISTADRDSKGSELTVKDLATEKLTTTKITIHGYLPDSKPPRSRAADGRDVNSRLTNHSRNESRASSNRAATAQQKESELLVLHPPNQGVASEWLDGLLMLLNQQPITAETNKLVQMIGSYGLKIRLLNVRFDEQDYVGEPEMPSREGLDEDYYYDL